MSGERSEGRRGSEGHKAATVRPSLVDDAERALRDWLAPGRYRSGDRLPPEHEVAAMLGVSRGTLRSALQRLEESGEIVRRQGSGTFVGGLAEAAAFDERLERLEPYSSVARRRGIRLGATGVTIQWRAVGAEASAALGLESDAVVLTVARTLLADDAPVAVMFDAVHPAIDLPAGDRLHSALEGGEMVLDLLIAAGVPITYARTRVHPALLSPRQRSGRQLGVHRTTAGLELEELIFAGRDQPVAYSRDLFAPGGIEVMVMRSLDSPAPARLIEGRAGRRSAQANRSGAGRLTG